MIKTHKSKHALKELHRLLRNVVINLTYACDIFQYSITKKRYSPFQHIRKEILKD